MIPTVCSKDEASCACMGDFDPRVKMVVRAVIISLSPNSAHQQRLPNTRASHRRDGPCGITRISDVVHTQRYVADGKDACTRDVVGPASNATGAIVLRRRRRLAPQATGQWLRFVSSRCL
ncbi:hypothetical protein J3459_018036 [Metarhizium acridum]|nr:hypothetical protein J3459_018036 [Metarhizium acridum]